jgi:hypothetical protein
MPRQNKLLLKDNLLLNNLRANKEHSPEQYD